VRTALGVGFGVDVVDGVGREQPAGVEFYPAVREDADRALVEDGLALEVGVHRRVRAGDREIRLPGSGGACDIACMAGRTVILMAHESRRFVERVHYVTSPGHGEGEHSADDGRASPPHPPRSRYSGGRASASHTLSFPR
jgi:hypothetical protein